MKLFFVPLSDTLDVATDNNLSPAELERVSRTSDAGKRAAMVDAFSQRRAILSSELGIAASSIEFDFDRGKPRVRNSHDFHFNTSYSDGCMVMICAQQQVGIDVEKIDFVAADHLVSELLFSADELSHLRSVSEQDFQKHYFEIWTQKEALVKGIGKGFDIEFSDFSISPGGGRVRAAEQVLVGEKWFTKPQQMKGDYIVSVAAEHKTPEYELIHWR